MYKKYFKRHLIKYGIKSLSKFYLETSDIKFWKKSFRLDVYYVKNVSFFLDIKIFLKITDVLLFKKKQFKNFKKLYE